MAPGLGTAGQVQQPAASSEGVLLPARPSDRTCRPWEQNQHLLLKLCIAWGRGAARALMPGSLCCVPLSRCRAWGQSHRPGFETALQVFATDSALNKVLKYSL